MFDPRCKTDSWTMIGNSYSFCLVCTENRPASAHVFPDFLVSSTLASKQCLGLPDDNRTYNGSDVYKFVPLKSVAYFFPSSLGRLPDGRSQVLS
jgi:hypothetical protein